MGRTRIAFKECDIEEVGNFNAYRSLSMMLIVYIGTENGEVATSDVLVTTPFQSIGCILTHKAGRSSGKVSAMDEAQRRVCVYVWAWVAQTCSIMDDQIGAVPRALPWPSYASFGVSFAAS